MVSDGEEKGVYGEVLSYVRWGGKYEERRGLDERKIWRSCGDCGGTGLIEAGRWLPGRGGMFWEFGRGYRGKAFG